MFQIVLHALLVNMPKINNKQRQLVFQSSNYFDKWETFIYKTIFTETIIQINLNFFINLRPLTYLFQTLRHLPDVDKINMADLCEQHF